MKFMVSSWPKEVLHLEDCTSDNCMVLSMGPCVPVSNDLLHISFSSMMSLIHAENLLSDSDTNAGTVHT